MNFLIQIIEKGAKITGDQKHLEAALNLARGTITEVKNNRRSLPIEACFKLAEITDADLVRLIAESEAITAKNPEKAEFWKKKLEALAAGVFIFVTLNMTPTPAEAAPMLQSESGTMYIMSNRRRLQRLKQWILKALQMCIPKPLSRMRISRVDHMPT